MRDRVLLRFEHNGKHGPDESAGGAVRDEWTLGDALEGTQVFGSTGSGKSSGSGAAIARAFLDPGRGNMGGLVLAAKEDEVDAWRGYMLSVGRDPSRDLVELRPGSGLRFNFLQHELEEYTRCGGAPEGASHNLVAILLASLSTGQATVSSVDPYWGDALRELLMHAVDLVIMASGRVQLEDLVAVVRSAPQNLDEVQQVGWQEQSFCFQCLTEANQRRGEHGLGRYRDLRQTVAYWCRDFPSLNERTRSIVVSSMTSKLAGMLRNPLREMFCTDIHRECSPSATHEGRVVLLNIPVKAFGEVGRFAQVLFKTIWQRSTERRSLVGNWRPTFLWADEAQYFVTTEDMAFQQTARSKFAATVYLTQNIPNYQAALGHGGQVAAESLLGNLQTKVFHANGDPSTNEWAQRTIGQEWASVHSTGQSGGGPSMSTSKQLAPQVTSSLFSQLLKGGAATRGEVSAVVFQAGRSWRTNRGRNFIEQRFKQDLRAP